MRTVGIGAVKADIVVPVVMAGGEVGERGTSEGAWDGLYWNIRCKNSQSEITYLWGRSSKLSCDYYVAMVVWWWWCGISQQPAAPIEKSLADKQSWLAETRFHRVKSRPQSRMAWCDLSHPCHAKSFPNSPRPDLHILHISNAGLRFTPSFDWPLSSGQRL